MCLKVDPDIISTFEKHVEGIYGGFFIGGVGYSPKG